MNVTSACPSTGFLKNPFAAFAEVVVFRVYRWFSRNNNDGDLAPAVSEALKEFQPIHLGHVTSATIQSLWEGPSDSRKSSADK